MFWYIGSSALTWMLHLPPPSYPRHPIVSLVFSFSSAIFLHLHSLSCVFHQYTSSVFSSWPPLRLATPPPGLDALRQALHYNILYIV